MVLAGRRGFWKYVGKGPDPMPKLEVDDELLDGRLEFEDILNNRLEANRLLACGRVSGARRLARVNADAISSCPRHSLGQMVWRLGESSR